MVTVKHWHTTGVDSHSHLFECYSSRRTKSKNRRQGDGGKPPCGECSHWSEALDGATDSRIKGMHGIFFTPKAEEARSFIQEKLGLPHVDAGDGWLIFGVAAAEFAFHPGDDAHHDISFWCDDIEATRADLQKKGVRFNSPVTDQGFGLVTTFELPGGLQVMLYEPRHPQP